VGARLDMPWSPIAAKAQLSWLRTGARHGQRCMRRQAWHPDLAAKRMPICIRSPPGSKSDRQDRRTLLIAASHAGHADRATHRKLGCDRPSRLIDIEQHNTQLLPYTRNLNSRNRTGECDRSLGRHRPHQRIRLKQDPHASSTGPTGAGWCLPFSLPERAKRAPNRNRIMPLNCSNAVEVQVDLQGRIHPKTVHDHPDCRSPLTCLLTSWSGWWT